MPNVSEGRDGTIIARIAESITSTGCRLLDVHSDPDHHRSVFTMIGDEEQITDGVVALVKSATALIDLRVHRGVHPRIGAVDVIPFVPLGSTKMSACVSVAEHVGRTVAQRFTLPVFLYGAAARSIQRASLPWIRRGELQGLSEKLTRNPPDFGPQRLHPTAGAIAVGARPPLVAFNVVLDTEDVSVALQIAATIREANGGLPGVKALGLSLASRQRVQVSMNLTRLPKDAADVTATTIPAALRAVDCEAKRLGASVLESEIVGLLPRSALGGATAADLLMREDPSDLILEARIAEHMT